MNSINIRAGFRRLSIGMLALSWSTWLLVNVFANQQHPAQTGEQFGYGLIMTVVYMLICKGIAWVFNGFFPPQR